MAAIDDLIARIEDQSLRERLKVEFNRIAREKKFGLVFEEHLPELTPIYNTRVRRHSKVALRSGPLADLWRVLSTRDGKAHCRNIGSGETREIPMEELVVVRQFGEPIFPALAPVDKVQNGPDDAPWHTLIEADNYHALQLLEYLYAGKVDCIYIDPPYNTGARDWKYNNDYVDTNDQWRHSKWLAMMQRRLRIAVNMLKSDGVLIVAIDDYEVHHLNSLLEQIFPSFERSVFVVNHHPQGAGGNNISRTHEYAIVITPGDSDLLRGDLIGAATEYRSFMRSGTAENNYRHGRPNSFYAVLVDSTTKEIKGLEPPPHGQHYQTDNTIDGYIRVYPISRSGEERVWRRAYDKDNEQYIIESIICSSRDTLYQVVKHDGRRSPPISNLIGKRYNSGTHGTNLISNVLGQTGLFSYPKSIYTVADFIEFVTFDRTNALVLDFFAGSGTTLNAVNLLNAMDGGNRRCIMVTNNEVSEEEAQSLKIQGYEQGQPEWEQHGICQSVTWPRSQYTILGKRDDGSELEGEYLTGKTIEKEKPRKFRQIAFTSMDDLTTAAQKKQLVALIDGIPQSEVTRDSAFVVSEKHPVSILFDDSQADAWLEALEGQEHMTDFYMVTAQKATFDDLKARIHDRLGPMIMTEEEKRPLRDGFPANLEYFRLDFLDKDHVALGRQFREILPILWLRAGAIGPRPELPKNKPVPSMLIPAHNPFAVLVEETRFADFAAELEGRNDLTHVYLVTDSEEAFREMAGQLKIPNVIQIYRDYLENFVINKGTHES